MDTSPSFDTNYKSSPRVAGRIFRKLRLWMIANITVQVDGSSAMRGSVGSSCFAFRASRYTALPECEGHSSRCDRIAARSRLPGSYPGHSSPPRLEVSLREASRRAARASGNLSPTSNSDVTERSRHLRGDCVFQNRDCLPRDFLQSYTPDCAQ